MFEVIFAWVYVIMFQKKHPKSLFLKIQESWSSEGINPMGVFVE